MGWIGVGLLILSSGCVLYKHAPATVILSLFGWLPRHSASPQRAEPSEDGDLLVGNEEEQDSGHNIHIKDIGEGEDSSVADVATPSMILEPAEQTERDSNIPSMPTIPASKSRKPPQPKPPTLNLMGPPPRPVANVPLRPPPSAAASLRLPVTKKLSNAAFAPSRLTAAPARPSRQVKLEPGHSPLDWATLSADPQNNLRGKDAGSESLMRVRPSRLKEQNGRRGKDSWTEYQGKVYNITPYLPFHPGGEGELMRGAGKGAGKLFMEAHPWVNWEAMLGECLVGILVEEHDDAEPSSSADAANFDEMD